jgi:hypothetical protein
MSLQDSYVKKEFDPSFDLEKERQDALLAEMGLEDRDVKRLQKMQLSHDEAVCAKKEELETIRQHKGRKDDWEEFVEAKRRMGRALPHAEFLRGLRGMIPNLVVAPAAQRDRVGLYVTRNVPTDEVHDYRGQLKRIDLPVYLGWVELGVLPEYEIDLVNDAGVAVGQRRGWRTILLRLHLRKYLCPKCQQGERPNKRGCGIKGCGRPTPLASEDAILKAFGHPSNGPTASNYRRQLYEFRNGVL